MIINVTIKSNIVKSLVKTLMDSGLDFEFNSIKNSFRIHNIVHWNLNEYSDCYGISTETLHLDSIIHKDNIESISIS